jgi:hypothetical protein
MAWIHDNRFLQTRVEDKAHGASSTSSAAEEDGFGALRARGIIDESGFFEPAAKSPFEP